MNIQQRNRQLNEEFNRRADRLNRENNFGFKTVSYTGQDGQKIEIEYDTTAPCRICHYEIGDASMSGTDVCVWCDMGKSRPENEPKYVIVSYYLLECYFKSLSHCDKKEYQFGEVPLWMTKNQLEIRSRWMLDSLLKGQGGKLEIPEIRTKVFDYVFHELIDTYRNFNILDHQIDPINDLVGQFSEKFLKSYAGYRSIYD